MKKVIFTYLLVLVSSVIFALPKQDSSIFNISCLDLKEYRLAGKWEFYWHKLLTPKELINERLTLKPLLIDVPSNWANDPRFFHYGYGTYHTKIILPKKNTLYAIKLIDIFCAYNIWINDSLYLKNGIVGDSRAKEKPKRGTQIVTFFTSKDTLDVVIEVSSYHHHNGGIIKAPVIGYAHYINNRFLIKSISVFFIFGGFIIFAIYLLWLYTYTKKNWDAFLLGFSILLAGIYTLFNDDFLITSIFPNISWVLVHKINFITNYGKIFFLLAFFKLFLKNHMSKIWNFIISLSNAVILLLIIVVFVTPTRFFSATLMIFIAALGAASVYIIIGYSHILKRENSKLFLIPFLGILILAAFALNDVLYEYQIIHSVYLSDFGLFIFVTTQAILISDKQINTLHKAERLTSYFKKLDKVKKQISEVRFDSIVPLLKTLKKHFKADLVMFFTIEGPHYYLRSVVDKNRVKEYERKIEINKAGSEKNRILSDFIELAVHNDEAFIISDRNKLYRLIKGKFNLGFKSILLSTIGSKGHPTGLIYLEKDHDYFSNSDEKLFNLISVQIATIVNNIKIFKQLQNININLQKIIDQRTQKVAERNKELEISNIELDEKVEELRITAEIITAMNDEIKSQQDILEQKNSLLTKQTKSLEKQKSIIEELNKQISESIQYALRIQNALLNSPNNLPLEHEHFILSIAKETVSGNFWWFHKVNDYEIIAFGQSDISGIHGAFLSLISFSLMNEILYQYLRNNNFEQVSIEKIEDQFNKKISSHLADQQVHFSVIINQPKTKKLKASHKNNFIYLLNSEIIQLAPRSSQESEIITIPENSYIVAFTNNFVKELINKDKIFKLDEINNLIEQLKELDSLTNIKTFFENYLVGSHDLDILIIGLNFD